MGACAPSQFVQPLQEGEHAVNASLGGPIVGVPGIGAIPIPNTTLGYGYGLSKKTTIHGALYPTAALYGNVQLSGGLLHEYWKKDKWGASWQPGFETIFDAYTKRLGFWPKVDAHVYFTYQKGEIKESLKRKFVYLGFSNWFELNSETAFGADQQRLIFNPHIGHQIKRNQWSFNFELKFLVPNRSNEKIVMDYKSLTGKHGATGIYFGVQYSIK